MLVIIGPILIALFGEAYSPSIVIFRLLFIGFLFNFIIEPVYLVAYTVNKPQILALVCVVKLIINVVANLILIPRMGALGAALAAVITHISGGIFALSLIYKYVYKKVEYQIAV